MQGTLVATRLCLAVLGLSGCDVFGMGQVDYFLVRYRRSPAGTLSYDSRVMLRRHGCFGCDTGVSLATSGEAASAREAPRDHLSEFVTSWCLRVTTVVVCIAQRMFFFFSHPAVAWQLVSRLYDGRVSNNCRSFASYHSCTNLVVYARVVYGSILHVGVLCTVRRVCFVAGI